MRLPQRKADAVAPLPPTIIITHTLATKHNNESRTPSTFGKRYTCPDFQATPACHVANWNCHFRVAILRLVLRGLKKQKQQKQQKQKQKMSVCVVCDCALQQKEVTLVRPFVNRPLSTPQLSLHSHHTLSLSLDLSRPLSSPLPFASQTTTLSNG